MDPVKVKAIAEWEAPTSVKGVRSFLGFANFYKRFIKDFSDLVRPLTDLTYKDRNFTWSLKADTVFKRLKAIFTSAPALTQFDFDRETYIKTDSLK